MLPILKESGLTPGEDLFVAHSPERILPGKALEELRTNSRIVGGITEESAQKVRDVYKSFVEGEILLTDSTTAEMCKLMENTFRDVNIALANELAPLDSGPKISTILPFGYPPIPKASSKSKLPGSRSGRRRPLHSARSMVPR